MVADRPLVGRDRELAVLDAAVARTPEHGGGLFLVGGEAGAGKTTLIESVLMSCGLQVLRGAGHPGGEEPFAPLVTALRVVLPGLPGPTRDELAKLLPGLDPVWPSTGEVGPTIHAVFDRLARARPTVVFVDDLQWADAATLAVLERWVPPVSTVPLLVIGAYRSDELPRRHPVRDLRTRLRRSAHGRDRHLTVEPLGPDAGAHLVRQVLGDAAAPEIVTAIVDRAGGLPFYLEELATAVAETPPGTGTRPATEIIPESVRDAVVARARSLPANARTAAEIAAVLGSPVRIDLLAELSPDEPAVDELLDAGLLIETPRRSGLPAEAAFRHDLVRESLYAMIPWTRRRRYHGEVALALEEASAPAAVVAAHWRQAHQPARALPMLLAAADAACEVSAYRDAKDALDQALALWPAAGDENARLEVLDRLGECAQRCGELADAARTWEEVAAARAAVGEHLALAHVQRRLAGVYELANNWPRALAARRTAAVEFAAAGVPAEAAAERLTAAEHLDGAGDIMGALDLVHEAWTEINALDGDVPGAAEQAGLRVRAMGLEGYIRAGLGEGATGVELTRRALDMALDSGLDAAAAEVYALHAYALEQATEYPAGLAAMANAREYCSSRGLDAEAHICLACFTPALRHTGQWDRALDVANEVMAASDAPEVARMVASGQAGLILANRGDTTQARRRLARASAFAQIAEIFGLEIETSWGLARVAELDGDDVEAAARLRDLCARCRSLDERHYSVAAVRWASTFFGRRGLDGDLGTCTDVLARVAGATGTAEATAALSHALGETALLAGDPRRAADQFDRTLQLLAAVGLPPEIAETQLRAGVSLAAAGDRNPAVQRLVAAYHTARALGARPLAASAATELAALGEDVTSRHGDATAVWADDLGLTRREREVLRYVADGLTNKEIAHTLFLSTRTIDMHVRNLLAKLSCHTRTEAVRRAGELALLDSTPS